MYTCEELEQLQERILKQRSAQIVRVPRFFLRDEVSLHNRRDDAWFIVNDRVHNLTPFLAKPDVLMNPPLEELLAFAGKDISHHFRADDQPATRISVHGSVLPTLAATAEYTIYTGGKQPVPTNGDLDGNGKPIVVEPDVGDGRKPAVQQPNAELHRQYWWQPNSAWDIGRITKAERKLRIINTMTMSRINMTVCEEDTLDDIRAKYNRRYNAHSGSYTWRKTFRNKADIDRTGSLDFKKTLTDNGILLEAHTSKAPAIWLFYDDDFTIA